MADEAETHSHFEYAAGPGERLAFAHGRASRDAEVAALTRQLAEARRPVEDKPEMPSAIDMSEPELLELLGVDAARWAKAFCEIATKLGYKGPEGLPIDEGWMISWFSNAMMAMHDHLRPNEAPVRLPDGSALVIGTVVALPKKGEPPKVE